MEIPAQLSKKFSSKPAKSPHLHSADHVLADELSSKFGEPKRFGFYLKMAKLHNHQALRRIAGQVLEGQAKNRGALFAYLIKKEHDSANQKLQEKKRPKNSAN